MSAREIVEDHGPTLGAVMILLPIFTGWLPIAGLLNPIWSSLFGLPIHIVLWLQPHPIYAPHPWIEALAALVWPFVVVGGLAVSTWRILQLLSPTRERAIAVWLVASAFLVPIGWMDSIPDWLFKFPLYVLD